MSVHHFDPRPARRPVPEESSPAAVGIAWAVTSCIVFWVGVGMLARACTHAVFGQVPPQ
jgi:hypothetical protein